jgi:hypothetical protein
VVLFLLSTGAEWEFPRKQEIGRRGEGGEGHTAPVGVKLDYKGYEGCSSGSNSFV